MHMNILQHMCTRISIFVSIYIYIYMYERARCELFDIIEAENRLTL